MKLDEIITLHFDGNISKFCREFNVPSQNYYAWQKRGRVPDRIKLLLINKGLITVADAINIDDVGNNNNE